MDDTNIIGNISTIVKYVSMLIAGYLISLLASKGLNLNISETMLSELIGSIIFLTLAHIDATHPNTFQILGNQKPRTYEEAYKKEPKNPEPNDGDEDDTC